MSVTVTGSRPSGGTALGPWELYKGWIIGLIIIVLVLSAGAGLWFHYHP